MKRTAILAAIMLCIVATLGCIGTDTDSSTPVNDTDDSSHDELGTEAESEAEARTLTVLHAGSLVIPFAELE